MKKNMMMRRISKKICSVEGCVSPLYAKLFCNYHYRTIYLPSKLTNKSIKRKHIASRTPKRLSQESKYHPKRKSFILHARDKDKLNRIFCIFCGGIIFSEPVIHHAKSRSNDKLLDEKYWFIAHGNCHQEYHDIPWNKIEWWIYYLNNIKDTYPDIYNKELIRQTK